MRVGRASLLLALGASALPSCCDPDPGVELVMRPGSRLEVTTASGKLSIIAGEGYDRRYEWGGCGIDASPCARRDRWYGSRGIYDPAPGFAYWRACDGIKRPVVEEEQQHFLSLEDAEAWLTRYARIWPDGAVWTNDGLLVSWAVTPERSQLNVDVVQICVNGQRPAQLPGARDSAIVMVPGPLDDSGRFDCVSASTADMIDAKRVWQEHWRQADEWAARQHRGKSEAD